MLRDAASRLLHILAWCLLFAASAAPAQLTEKPGVRVNVDYRLIEQQPVPKDGRVEVIDFFWYGCPHCYNLQPALEDWIARKPADVVVRRIPAFLRDSWLPHARIYYTLEALGEVERLHQQVYHGYHVQELHMSKPEVMEQWAARHGIEPRKWIQAYHSPEVTRRVERARELTLEYSVQGTPSLVVAGRYLTSPAMTGSERRMIPVLDELVRMARLEQSRR